QSFSMDGLPQRLAQLLDEIQTSLFQRGRQFRDEHTQRADNYDELTHILECRPGFVIAPWCGSAECEAQIKTDTQATIRNMPMTGAAVSGTCVRCDNPAKFQAWFAKAY